MNKTKQFKTKLENSQWNVIDSSTGEVVFETSYRNAARAKAKSLNERAVTDEATMNTVSKGQKILWGGKVREVSRFIVSTSWVFFTDGTSAKLNLNTMQLV